MDSNNRELHLHDGLGVQRVALSQNFAEATSRYKAPMIVGSGGSTVKL
jgi:hypothetical protein